VKAYLLDGTYELFRAFYGAPSAKTAAGVEVGAARALARSFLSLLKDPAVTHVACAFDHVIESFRNELFDGYKTGDGIDPELWAQFPVAERVTVALGIVTWPMVEFEADDAIATGACLAADDPRFERVYLASPDKDLAQCVRGDRVVMLDRMRQIVTDEPGVVAKFGVSPASIPDYLALVGDTADGIPGIPGWGAKSAGAILAAYGTIDAIPADCTAWTVKLRGAARLSSALEALREESRLYKKLATLREDVPLVATVDSLAWHGPDAAALDELIVELDDPGLRERVESVQQQRTA
jgi:5'-3' exonuclease